MISIVSDLHISDTTTATNVDPAAFTKLLGPEILDSARRTEATEIRLVLLGDIFDLVRTDYWFRNVPEMANRPWGGVLDPKTGMNNQTALIQKQFEDVLDSALATDSAKGLIDMINAIGNECNKPGGYFKAKKYFKVTYVIGNHDRAMNNFPSLQKKIRERITSVPSDQVEFLNVLDAPEYGLFARHGHEWDENCHGWKFHNAVLEPAVHLEQFDREVYNVMALGEVITSELMAGIVYRTKQLTGDQGFVNKIMEVNNLRPMMDVFSWIEWTARNATQNEKNAILSALKESIKGVLDSSLAIKWDDLKKEIVIVNGDLTDTLDHVHTLIGERTFDDLKSFVPLAKAIQGVAEFFSGDGDDYVDGAQKEWEYGRTKQYQFVVYGHTHEARHDYFLARPDGTVQMYINTGTYLPLIQQTNSKQGFSTAHQMTMVHFYNSNEDIGSRSGPGPTMELWNGLKRKEYT